jgi:hypothetical protein
MPMYKPTAESVEILWRCRRNGLKDPAWPAWAGVAGQQGWLLSQVGEDGQDPAVVFGCGQQAELGEQVPDVRLDGLG